MCVCVCVCVCVCACACACSGCGCQKNEAFHWQSIAIKVKCEFSRNREQFLISVRFPCEIPALHSGIFLGFSGVVPLPSSSVVYSYSCACFTIFLLRCQIFLLRCQNVCVATALV